MAMRVPNAKGSAGTDSQCAGVDGGAHRQFASEASAQVTVELLHRLGTSQVPPALLDGAVPPISAELVRKAGSATCILVDHAVVHDAIQIYARQVTAGGMLL